MPVNSDSKGTARLKTARTTKVSLRLRGVTDSSSSTKVIVSGSYSPPPFLPAITLPFSKIQAQHSQLPYYQKRKVLSTELSFHTNAAKLRNSLEVLSSATPVLCTTSEMHTLPHVSQVKARMLAAYVHAQFSTRTLKFNCNSKQVRLTAYNSRLSSSEVVVPANEAASARNGSRYRSMTRRQLVRQRTLLHFFIPNVPLLRSIEKIYATPRQKDKYTLLHNRYRALFVKPLLRRDYPRHGSMQRLVHATSSLTPLSNKRV
jgi:hypothetical protein